MYCIQSYSYRVYIYWHQGVAKLVSQQLVEFWVDVLFLQGLKEFFFSDFREVHQLFLMAPEVQIRWNFCNIFITYWDMAIFEFSVFFNSDSYLLKNFVNFLKSEFSFCPPELRSVGIFKISLTVYQLEMFKFWNFWQCASQCIKNFYIKKLFCT